MAFYKVPLRYTVEELYHSIDDIYLNLDEGEITEEEADNMAERCCHAFIKGRLSNKEAKMHYSLASAFGRGILDGDQLNELLTIYKGATK